jgi:hypothetical protein
MIQRFRPALGERTRLPRGEPDRKENAARDYIAAHGRGGCLANALVAAATVNLVDDAKERVVGARCGRLGDGSDGGKVKGGVISARVWGVPRMPVGCRDAL